MTELPPLTANELADWERNGVGADEARRWYEARYELLGPPSPEAWDYQAYLTPSQHTITWAMVWRTAFGAGSYADAAPWLAAFSGIFGDAQAAASFRNAGWGAPGNQVRTVEAAAAFARAQVKPDEAGAWLAAGFSTERALKHLAARVSLEEATKEPLDDEKLDLLAALLADQQPTDGRVRRPDS